MLIRRAGDAGGFDSVIDAFCESSIFHEACALAGIVGKSFCFSRMLDPAAVHFKDEGSLFPAAGLDVQPPVEAEVQRFFESFEARMLRKAGSVV